MILITIVFFSDIYLSLHGNEYSNNSVVTLTDIGNDSDTALVCHTSISGCCGMQGSSDIASCWRYPNDMSVTSYIDEPFRRNRGSGVIRLLRRDNASGLTGIYLCEIVNRTTTNTLQELYVGIYPLNKGRVLENS